MGALCEREMRHTSNTTSVCHIFAKILMLFLSLTARQCAIIIYFTSIVMYVNIIVHIFGRCCVTIIYIGTNFTINECECVRMCMRGLKLFVFSSSPKCRINWHWNWSMPILNLYHKFTATISTPTYTQRERGYTLCAYNKTKYEVNITHLALNE